VTAGGKAAPSPANAVTILAAAHAEGINSHWQSDVRIYNPTSSTVHYRLFFTPSQHDGTVNGQRADVTVGPGVTLALNDLVRHLFGYGALGAEGDTGAIEVRALDSDVTPVVTSRTYNVSADGTYGQFIPALPVARFVGAGSTISMQQAAQSTAYRTNLGLLEGAGVSAPVQVRAYDDAGNELTRFDVTLAPY